MNYPEISQDDLYDVEELSDTLVDVISKSLEDHELDLAMSALIGATIKLVIEQCDDKNEVIAYRNCFFKFFDQAIDSIRKK